MFCGDCGKPIREGEKFCESCGRAVSSAAPAPAPANSPHSGRSAWIILTVFLLVMGFLGYEMMQFRLAGKKVSGVDVTVLPAQLTLRPGETHRLEASIIGSENTDVGWSVQEGTTGGVVVAAGASAHDGRVFSAATYTAPARPGIYHVIATSQADQTRASSATITVPQP